MLYPVARPSDDHWTMLGSIIVFKLLVCREIEGDMHNVHIRVIVARPISECVMIDHNGIGEPGQYNGFKEAVQEDGVVYIEDHLPAE